MHLFVIFKELVEKDGGKTSTCLFVIFVCSKNEGQRKKKYITALFGWVFWVLAKPRQIARLSEFLEKSGR